jgi:hypothetical protein
MPNISGIRIKKQGNAERQEDVGESFFMWIKASGDEQPDLVEHPRGRYDRAEHEARLEPDHECFLRGEAFERDSRIVGDFSPDVKRLEARERVFGDRLVGRAGRTLDPERSGNFAFIPKELLEDHLAAFQPARKVGRDVFGAAEAALELGVRTFVVVVGEGGRQRSLDEADDVVGKVKPDRHSERQPDNGAPQAFSQLFEVLPEGHFGVFEEVLVVLKFFDHGGG